MNTILTIFSAIAKNESISISALEKSIGASKGVVSRPLKNVTDIQVKWLIALLEHYPGYNPEWIWAGKGQMLKHPYHSSTKELHQEGKQYQHLEKVSALEEQINI